MTIEYKINQAVTVEQFRQVLIESSLAERRPVDDIECLEGMLKHSNLSVTAWENHRLIGIARSVTDFHYACYLSDLAVSEAYKNQGIGKRLQVITQEQLGPQCKLILIAAPAANDYYQHIGFTNNPRCYVLDRHEQLG